MSYKINFKNLFWQNFHYFIFAHRSDDDEEEIKENSEISSNNDKTELYLSPFEAFYLTFGLGCLVVREEKDELHLTIGIRNMPLKNSTSSC